MVNHAAEAQEADEALRRRLQVARTPAEIDEAFEARRRVRYAHAQELARLMRPARQIEAIAEIALKNPETPPIGAGDGKLQTDSSLPTIASSVS